MALLEKSTLTSGTLSEQPNTHSIPTQSALGHMLQSHPGLIDHYNIKLETAKSVKPKRTGLSRGRSVTTQTRQARLHPVSIKIFVT